MLTALERLRLFLRPPGKGVYTSSTGGGYAAELLQSLYGSSSVTEVQKAWEDQLQRVRRAKTVLLCVPSDSGAGIMRGSNFGPIGIRDAYLKNKKYPKDVLDLGDIICIPQLLHDEMLSESQLKASREALYPGISEALPVSPLSIAEEALYALVELNPTARVILLGGDHSVSWPAMLGNLKRYSNDFGVLHFDAHTDLLDHRLGVKYCFATWAFHALSRLKPRCLLQVGVRTSMKTKDYWEKALPVTQIWAQEVLENPAGSLQKIVKHFKSLGLKKIYISNDIDGTDLLEAPATGTPEGSGLHANWIESVIQEVRSNFELIGGDIVEVAPTLSGQRDFASEKTCQLAARYLDAFFY